MELLCCIALALLCLLFFSLFLPPFLRSRSAAAAGLSVGLGSIAFASALFACFDCVVDNTTPPPHLCSVLSVVELSPPPPSLLGNPNFNLPAFFGYKVKVICVGFWFACDRQSLFGCLLVCLLSVVILGVLAFHSYW